MAKDKSLTIKTAERGSTGKDLVLMESGGPDSAKNTLTAHVGLRLPSEIYQIVHDESAGLEISRKDEERLLKFLLARQRRRGQS